MEWWRQEKNVMEPPVTRANAPPIAPAIVPPAATQIASLNSMKIARTAPSIAGNADKNN
jgi:hypothetical protein